MGTEPEMSDESSLNVTVDLATLTNTQRGQLAELAFMRKAASLGFSVSKPWQEGERYDVIVRVNEVFWRVQVKSVLAKAPMKPHYRISITGGAGIRHRHRKVYSADEIDFLAAYVFPEDIWYIVPVARVENHNVICVRPGSKRSRLEQYREAWGLMRTHALDTMANTISIQAVAHQEAAAST